MAIFGRLRDLAHPLYLALFTLRMEMEFEAYEIIEDQIHQLLKDYEEGMPAVKVCEKYGISAGSFYKYRSKFGIVRDCENRQMEALEEENTKLKKLLAEKMLDNAMLRDAHLKKK